MFLLQDVEPHSCVLHLARVPPRHQFKRNLSSNDSTSNIFVATLSYSLVSWEHVVINHKNITWVNDMPILKHQFQCWKWPHVDTHNMVEPNCSFYMWICCRFGETVSCKRCLNMLDECSFCWWQPIDCSSLLCKQVADLG